MDADIAWRADFTGTEANALHAEAFTTRVFSDQEWDWRSLVATHSLRWVTARCGGQLAGFANVVWDGRVHAWLQDVMVAVQARHQAVGTAMVGLARGQGAAAGCEWLHVDYAPGLGAFYVQACDVTPTEAGLIHL